MIAWDPVIEALAAQAPYWDPGSTHGYHAVTYGYLVGEVVRRITGKSLGTFFHDEFAVPLDLEFWIGLPRGPGAPGGAARRRPGISDGGALADEASPLSAILGPDSLLVRARCR